MKMNKWLTTVIAATAICFGASNLMAQNNGNNNNSNNNNGGNNNGGNNNGRRNRGNFDPSQMQQRMMDNIKEQLEITDDSEWKAIEPMVQKILDLRRETSSGMGRLFRGNRNNDNSSSTSDSNRPRGGGFFGPPSPESEALQKAIDGKASNSEMKAAIAKYQEAHNAKMAELQKAQSDLRKVLTLRQEAVATLDGLL